MPKEETPHHEKYFKAYHGKVKKGVEAEKQIKEDLLYKFKKAKTDEATLEKLNEHVEGILEKKLGKADLHHRYLPTIEQLSEAVDGYKTLTPEAVDELMQVYEQSIRYTMMQDYIGRMESKGIGYGKDLLKLHGNKLGREGEHKHIDGTQKIQTLRKRAQRYHMDLVSRIMEASRGN